MCCEFCMRSPDPLCLLCGPFRPWAHSFPWSAIFFIFITSSLLRWRLDYVFSMVFPMKWMWIMSIIRNIFFYVTPIYQNKIFFPTHRRMYFSNIRKVGVIFWIDFCFGGQEFTLDSALKNGYFWWYSEDPLECQGSNPGWLLTRQIPSLLYCLTIPNLDD